MKDITTLIGIIVLSVFGFLSTVCSGIIAKYTPVVTVVVIVLEILSITNYGIWTVLGYGLLTYIIAWFIIGMNLLALAIFVSK